MYCFYTNPNNSYWWSNSTRPLSPPPTTKCGHLVFDDPTYSSTIASDFLLVCGGEYKRKFSQAFFMGGVAMGASFWGAVSDGYDVTVVCNVKSSANKWTCFFKGFKVKEISSSFCRRLRIVILNIFNWYYRYYFLKFWIVFIKGFLIFSNLQL